MGLIKDIKDIENLHDGVLNSFLTINKKSNDEWIFDVDWNGLLAWFKLKHTYTKGLLVYKLIDIISDSTDETCALEWMSREGINTDISSEFYTAINKKVLYTCKIENLESDFLNDQVYNSIYKTLDVVLTNINSFKSCQICCFIHTHKINCISLKFELWG